MLEVFQDAIISYITAFITCLICKWLREKSNECRRRERNNCCDSRNDDIVDTRINVIPNSNNNGRTGCICGRYLSLIHI